MDFSSTCDSCLDMCLEISLGLFLDESFEFKFSKTGLLDLFPSVECECLVFLRLEYEDRDSLLGDGILLLLCLMGDKDICVRLEWELYLLWLKLIILKC